MTGFDPAQVLEARLWIARLGETDTNGWWRTDGVLGEDGAFVGPRVLPKTHGTARARITFAVARHACAERYPDPKARHLFQLDPETDDRLDAHLVDRLGDFEFWASILRRLETIQNGVDTAGVLSEAGLVTPEDLAYVQGLSLGPDSRSLAIAPGRSPEETLRRLAAGFTRSQPGQLAVPHLKGP